MNKNDAKKVLRPIFSKFRQSLTTPYRQYASQKITRNLVSNQIYRNSRVVAAFIGFSSEVETSTLIKSMWSQGKTVVLPICKRGFNHSFFVLHRRQDRLMRTDYGPLEISDNRAPFRFEEIDLVLVPGLAVDSRGYRLGYGGGVYDRLLAKTGKAHHMGLFFSVQETPFLPVQSHDRPLDGWVTENGWRCLSHERFKAHRILK